MEPKWLTLARADLGTEEISGPDANPRIMTYYKAAGADWAKDDDVPWCGAACAAWVSGAGWPVPVEAARARAWLEWGDKLDTPRIGAVTVFARGTDPQAGHVALFLEDKGDKVMVLGGNQGDAVSITSYPKSALLGYRWPTGAEVVRAPATVTKRAAKPLTRSGTIWAGLCTIAAGCVQYLETAFSVGFDIIAQLATWEPVKAALLQAGGNTKAIGLGVGVSAGIVVLGRRAQTAQAARAETEGE